MHGGLACVSESNLPLRTRAGGGGSEDGKRTAGVNLLYDVFVPILFRFFIVILTTLKQSCMLFQGRSLRHFPLQCESPHCICNILYGVFGTLV